MPYLVKIGTLIVVASSSSEAKSLRATIVESGSADVIITDMDGLALDPDTLPGGDSSPVHSTGGPA